MSIVHAEYTASLEASDWLASVGPGAAKNAGVLQRLGGVERLEIRTVGGDQVGLVAQVREGRDSLPVLVFLSRRPGGNVMVAPNCPCGAGGMCLHVVAVVQTFMTLNKQEARLVSSKKPKVDAVRRERRPRRRAASKKSVKREVQFLACQIVPVGGDGGVGLEVLYSPRPVINSSTFNRCSGKELFQASFRENLGRAWMRSLVDKLREEAGEEVATSEEPLCLRPTPERWTKLIEELTKWQSLYWGGGPNPILLHCSGRRAAQPVWRVDPAREGVFLTDWEVTPAVEAIIPALPLAYVDTRLRLTGRVDTELPDALAARWTGGDRQPSAAQVETWNQEAAKAKVAGRFPLPPRQEVLDARGTRPVPCLRLGRRELPRNTMRGLWSPVYLEQPVAELVFAYGEHLVPERGRALSLTDERIRLLRNEEAEQEAGAILERLGLASFHSSLPEAAQTEDLVNIRWVGTWESGASEAAWMTFMVDHLGTLEKAGWTFHYDDDFDMRFVRPDRWVQKLHEKRNRSWFEFELGVECDGENIDLIPVVIAYLEDHVDIEQRLERTAPDEKIPVRLEDGRFLAFPARRLQPIIKVLKDIMEGRRLRGGDADETEVHRVVAAEFLQESSGFTDAGDAGSTLQIIAHRLRSFDGVFESEPPAGLQATLRDYQKEGFQWLQFLSHYGLGGILADDMGLGKTLQTIAHVLSEKEKGALSTPALVVAPTSLLGNWQDEMRKFAPALNVHLHYGTDRHQSRQSFDAADVIITSFSLVYRDLEFLQKRCFSQLILDEAQNIKNPESRSAQAICALNAEHRLCLSGTPMENHLEELWSLFHFLMPGFLGGRESFRQRFRYPIEKEQDEQARELLASRVRPLMLRRKKTEVARELPPKTEMVRTVELEGSQRDLYETIRASMQQRVQEVIAEQGMERAHLYILEALLKLRQVCCHPHLLDLEAAQNMKESAKTEMLFEMLPEMIAEGRRVLLFSQFTSMLGLIGERLEKEGIPYVKLTGQTRKRKEMVDRFQKGEVPLFLISLKAGGVGLNLTTADTVIHYDPWWNPAVEAQATDRAYRIGQQNPVFVYKLITKGSIEERIVALQEDKKELVQSLLGSGGGPQKPMLRREDLEHLFRPLGA